MSSLFHVAFCPLFATLGSRCTLFLRATSLPHHATCFRYHTNPPIWVPWKVHRNILQGSTLVPEPFCWQYYQPQLSLLESSFLIFLCISSPEFCLFYLVPTVLPCPSPHLVMSPLWFELLGSCRALNRWCQEQCCHERWHRDQSLSGDWREEEILKDILKDRESRSVAGQALINRKCCRISSKFSSSHNTLKHFTQS